jgi:soluble lytic murein transglycosylase-like protein
MKKIMIFAAALAIMTSAAEARSAIPYVKQAAIHYGVPVSTAIKVCMVESRCRCNVRRGAAGEIGPMQVLPRTARGIRMSLKGCKNQVYAGVKYLRMALRAGGVWKYNQGTGAKRKTRAGAKYERMVRNARTR